MKLSDIIINQNRVEEGGLSRIWQKTQQPFAIITAFRDGFTKKENINRNRHLEKSLKKIQAGGIKLDGHWAEAPDGMEYEEAVAKGLTQDVEEESYFVPKPVAMEYIDFEKFIKTLMKTYNQDAAVLSDGKDVMVVYQNGSVEKKGKTAFGKVAQAYSTLRGRPNTSFIFEGYEII